VNPQFDEAAPFAEGLARVQLARRWGYVDKTGVFSINPQFDDAGDFQHGLAQVREGRMVGYVDTAGKYVWNLTK
jgi:hypothetical protein